MTGIAQETIIEWCQAPDRDIIGGFGRTTKAIRVGRLAIKHGAVFEEEANNQREAFRLLHPEVRVPEVYQYFRISNVGYLVQEYIEGIHRQCINDDESLQAIAESVEKIHAVLGDRPGPALGGISRGLLWPEDARLSFDSCEQLENFVKSRSLSHTPDFKVQATDLRFCHMDLAPRNILFTPSLVFLDWAHAGYYPSSFEIAALRCNYGEECCDIDFCSGLERALCVRKPLADAEFKQIDIVLQCIHNSAQFFL